MADISDGETQDLLTGFPREFQMLLGRASAIAIELPLRMGNQIDEVDNHVNNSHVLMAWLEQLDCSPASTEMVFKRSALSQNWQRELEILNAGASLHELTQIYYGPDIICTLGTLRNMIRSGKSITTADYVDVVVDSRSGIAGKVISDLVPRAEDVNTPVLNPEQAFKQLANTQRNFELAPLGPEYSLILQGRS